MKQCYMCQESTVELLLDFGGQPVSHRFLASVNDPDYLGSLKIGQCQKCGLVQQMNPMPVNELRPRFDWLTGTEPERHLDDLVQTLTNLQGVGRDSKILGISWKEDTTLQRFNKLGYRNTWRLDLKDDLGVTESCSNVETVQARLTKTQAEQIASKRGKVDIVIVRHLIEHAFDVREFMAGLDALLKPDGYLVLEIPDCKCAMEHWDYTTVWEEHAIYFTPETFKQCFSCGRFRLIDFIEEEYSLENSYIGIALKDTSMQPALLPPDILKEELKRGRCFKDGYEGECKDIKNYLMDFKRNRGKIAIFGAAHMSSAFINLMGLKDCIEFIVDDNPHKNGMFMPGSHLPIRGSSAILEEDIKLCLLTLAVASEEKVLANSQEFINKGGIFKSIFPRNPNALAVKELNGKY